MTKKQKRRIQKIQKIQSLLCMIAAGMIHLAIIFAAAMFAAAVRRCKWPCGIGSSEEGKTKGKEEERDDSRNQEDSLYHRS